MALPGDLPQIDVVARIASGSLRPPRFFYVALTGSGIAHATVLAIFVASMSFVDGPHLHPPRSGMTSIQLTASLQTAPEPETPEPIEFAANEIMQATEPIEPDRLATLDMAQPAVTHRRTDERLYPPRRALRTPAADPDIASSVDSDATRQSSPESPTAAARDVPPRQSPSRRAPSRPLAEPNRPATQVTIEPRSQLAKNSTSSPQASGANVDELPTKVHSPRPEYPADALSAGLTGRVVLRVKIGSDGRVQRASIYRTSGVASLDQSALKTVRDWRFEPARLAGIAVSTEIAVPIRFEILDPR